MRNRTFDFYLDGARLYSGAVRDIIGELCALFDGQPRDIAGVRLHGIEALRPFVGIEGRIGAIAASIIPGSLPRITTCAPKTPSF